MSGDPLRPWREAADAVRDAGGPAPRAGIILGTGLGGLAREVEVVAELSYRDIPHMPVPTVETHEGRLLLGHLEGTPVAVLAGRFHLYEGYSAAQAAFPVRVLALLGARALLISGACGAMDPRMEPGDLVLLDDHLNLLGENPLTGPNLDAFGPRFPDMSEPYDGELRALARRHATELGLVLRDGVYAAVPGPQLETRAEYRMLRRLGADVVGMSTVPEVIAARHAGLRVLALPIVTDMGLPDALEPVSVERILATAARAEPHLTRLLSRVVGDLDSVLDAS